MLNVPTIPRPDSIPNGEHDVQLWEAFEKARTATDFYMTLLLQKRVDGIPDGPRPRPTRTAEDFEKNSASPTPEPAQIRRRGRRRQKNKLTLEQVDEIKALTAEGKMLQKDIAAQFGVTASVVSRIKAGDYHRKGSST